MELAIDDKTKVDKLNHTAGTLNISDLGTRGSAKFDDIKDGSEWQLGPSYLRDDRATWPISRGFSREIPPEEKRNKS